MRVNVSGRWFSGIALLASVACGEVGERTVVISTGADADVLIPALGAQAPSRVYAELMFDKLADIGHGQNSVGDGGYQPRLAQRWTWAADSLSITFHLDPRARWHDGRAVTADDVQYAFAVYTDPKTAANGGADMARMADSVSVGDSLTATVWYKARAPEQFHAIAYNLFPLPRHLLAAIPHDSLRLSPFASNPVGSGPFKFVAWEKSRRFELAANDAYALGRPKLDRVIFAISSNAQTAARAVFAGDADFIEQVTLDDVAEAARLPDVKIVPAPRYDYGFMAFNLHTPDGKGPHPIFANVGVRRALTMAVDRAALVRNVYDSLGRVGIGPFARSQWTADTTLATLPYDTAGAARLLDSLGWRTGPAGTRMNGGRPLAFTIVVSASSRPRVRYSELVQQAFARVGAKVEVDVIDQKALGERVTAHTFDAALFSWSATPSPVGTRQTWGSQAYRPAWPFNAGGWANATFDAHVDSGLASLDMAKARAHFRVAYQAAIDDPPAIWLYDPMVAAAMSRRLVTGPFRADAWWAEIRSWDVTGPPRGGTATKSP